MLLRVLLLSVLAMSVPAAADEAKFSSRVMAIVNLVQERHVDPPAKQQLILAGSKSVYRAAKKHPPRKLSAQVSALGTEQELKLFVKWVEGQIALPREKFQNAFLEGMFASLPGGARLISAAERKVQNQLAANRYVGTGIVLSMNRDQKRPSIPKAFYNGPAWKAGVKSGDIILAIDGKTTEKMSLRDVVDKLRGKAGSIVEMTVRQPNDEKPRVLKVTRGVAFIPTVEGHQQLAEDKWEYRVGKERNLAFIRINRIGSSTLHELKQVLQRINGKRIEGVILDLRNGGGILHDTVMIADALIDGGQLGSARDGQKITPFKATPGAWFKGIPIVVLIGKHGGNDREFLAAALRDRRKAILVGEPTRGEGLIRSSLPIPGFEQALTFATGDLLRADDTPLRTTNGKEEGLRPDHTVPLTQRNRARLLAAYSNHRPGLRKPIRDATVSKAIEVLSAKIKQARATTHTNRKPG